MSEEQIDLGRVLMLLTADKAQSTKANKDGVAKVVVPNEMDINESNFIAVLDKAKAERARWDEIVTKLEAKRKDLF
jgi:hypothetical protein